MACEITDNLPVTSLSQWASSDLPLADNVICFVKTTDKILIRPSPKFNVPFQDQFGRAKYRPTLCYPQPMMQYPLKIPKRKQSRSSSAHGINLDPHNSLPPHSLYRIGQISRMSNSLKLLKQSQWPIHRNPFHQMKNSPNLFSLCFNWLVFLLASKGRMLNLISCNSWRKEDRREEVLLNACPGAHNNISFLLLISQSCFLWSRWPFLFPESWSLPSPHCRFQSPACLSGLLSGHRGQRCCSSFPLDGCLNKTNENRHWQK